MKISQLIEKLQEQKAENGDMDIVLIHYRYDVDKQEYIETKTDARIAEPTLEDFTGQVKLAIY